MDHDRRIDHLVSRDRELASLVERFGRPAPFRRPPGFATLVLVILEQQVSLGSAAAAFHRLSDATEVTPSGLDTLDDDQLRAIGFSRQKIRYVRGLAAAVREGRLGLDDLVDLTDDEVRARLTAVTGIGPWTADVYLLAVLDRPDVWPVTDRALQLGTREALDLPDVPDQAGLAQIGDRWRPQRSTAARLIWHGYLAARGRSAPPVWIPPPVKGRRGSRLP